MDIFNEQLKAAGMRKKDLREVFGLNRQTIGRWGQEPPRYVMAYLELRIENVRLRAALEECEGVVKFMTKPGVGRNADRMEKPVESPDVDLKVV